MILKKYFLKIEILFSVSFILSCSHFTTRIIETPELDKWLVSNDTPKVVAILPFSNETEVEGLEQLIRESFYEYFSVRSFHDVEIKEIDATIKMLEGTEGKDFRKIQPKKLGEFLRCDALVYGKVKRFKRIFLLIYAQTLIETEIRILEAQSGKELWKYSLTKRFHEGGAPTGPFGIIPAAIRTTYSLRDSKRNRDIDAFCKDFVSCIPEVKSMQAKRTKEFCDVQLASFKLKEGALHISFRLSQYGYKPFLREACSNGEIWHRVMIGPFLTREEAVQHQLKIKRGFSFLNPIVISRKNIDNINIKKGSAEPCDVQLASFKLKEGALHISSELSQHGYKPFLRKVNYDGKLWYRVLLGPFASRDDARRNQAKIKREFSFLDPVVVNSKNRDNLETNQNTDK